MEDVFSKPLADLISESWALRAQFDLSGIGYGRIHWDNETDIDLNPASYYYFLAGLVHRTKAHRVLEVGTHQGGSTKAIAKGFTRPSESRLVTFDVTQDGAKLFAGDQLVRAYTIDANTGLAYETVLKEFGGHQLDMAFIDSTHDFWTTAQTFAMCASILACPLIVLDDITLNDSMIRVWELIQRRYGKDNAINAVDVDSSIRTGGGGTTPGFGVVRIRV